MPERPTNLVTPKEEFSLFVSNVLDYAMFLLSPTGEIRSWNAGAERIMGYAANEVVGSHFSVFYTPEDLASEKPRRELEQATASGRVEDEGWRVRKDGGRFWADTIITALRDRTGELVGFAKITRDLTERRAREERLKRNEELFRLLVESVQDYAIYMLDPKGHVSSWNLGAERIKGYKPEEIIGKHFSIFYTAEDVSAGKPRQNLENAVANQHFEEEGWRVRKDGSHFWANVVITAVHDEHGDLRGFAKVTRDISARRQADETRIALYEQREARLRAEEERHLAEASYRAAQEANRAKDEFLMTLSHELRTPMTAILGWSRMLTAMSPSDPLFNEAIQAISRSATLQAQLIDDVLDVSRIVSGKLRLSLSNVEVAPILTAAVDAVRPSADARGVVLVLNFAPGLGFATVDPTRLQQIVWNLLSNAVKFTPAGGTVELSARYDRGQLQIRVTDTGEGIEAEFLPRVFEAFQQAETSSTRTHGGLGLGLSIVRYLTEAHGGQVEASSEGKGRGAQFTVTLPVRAIDHASPAAPERDTGKRPPPLNGRRILVVDDDPEGRALIVAALRYAGADVSSVDSAAAALEAARHQPPDLVLTDIAMPEMDGFALQRELRGQSASPMKIVALTAFPATAFNRQDAEFDSYLRKPIDPYELAATLGAILKPS
ncbi:MAG TPA: PAS domain S-box protein [Thermoanaerobaculia bacterium]|nr:PAS domain S-box protein [Thermoanaerobaculia bacterium]